MENDYAFAKLQSIHGEEFFIKKIPLIFSNTEGSQTLDTKIIRNINIIRCQSLQKYLGMIYYESDSFRFIPFVKTIINDQEGQTNEQIIQEIIDKLDEQRTLKVFNQYNNEYSYSLETMNRIHFPCQTCTLPHFFYFILPLREPVALLTKGTALNTYTPSKNPLNPFSKTPDRVSYARWGQEDRDLLKKILLQFGYGRLNMILRQAGQRFQTKTKAEIRAFSNAFIRSIIELVQVQHPELKQFLLNMVEEAPEDIYIEPSVRDWDLQNLKQKLVSVAKRIQLMSRIRIFMRKFKDDQLSRMSIKDKSIINWDQLLNFLPSQTMYSQRPAIWWTRKYDCDLLRGVYKYGYTNYNAIRQAADLGFAELDKTALYQEFPVPDTLNKRVKKVVSLVLKYEAENSKIDFGQTVISDEEIDSSWAPEERQALFDLLCDYGVPIAPDGRQSWQDLRDRLNVQKKSLGQLERMVQNIRITCQHMLVRSRGKVAEERDVNAQDFSNSQDVSSDEQEQEPQELQELQEGQSIRQEQEEMNVEQIPSSCQKLKDEGKSDANNMFQISLEDAHRFSKNTNLLHFIRKQVLPTATTLFTTHQEELQKSLETIKKDSHIHINDQFKLKDDDISLLQIVSTNGLSALNDLTKYPQFQNYKNITYGQAIARIEWLCSFFKNIRDQQNLKRKSEYNLKDDIGKKVKQSIVEKDPFSGELILPMQVNASLKLVSLGRILPLPNYHSEHNLFPVGYKSLRSYSSMFNKGQRCTYTCEILEGTDGKPIFKVTSEEDIDHPIIKSSCTGCWVSICQKVNELQDHRKAKVTISGTDRFGLLEPNVARYLEELPNAEDCKKYKFKYRTDLTQQQSFH